MKQIIVIGGGAAGMLAAIQAAGGDCKALLLEKNEKLGKKLFLTGKGRCNLTNACSREDMLQNIVTNPKFIYSALYGFDNQETMAFFERLGLRLKVERGGRVFPASDHSSDVIRTLEQELRRRRVEIRCKTAVKEIRRRAEGRLEVVTADGVCLPAERVIVATGGLSYPGTGSTGDGYRFAEKLGHTIEPCRPSLTPMTAEETWCRDLSGLSLKNVSVSLRFGEKTLYQGFGEMLFTHFGVSGPLILSASAYLGNCRGQKVTLLIDLKPALDEIRLEERLQRDFFRYQNRQLIHAMDDLLPKKLIPIVVACSGLSAERRVNGLTKTERSRLVHTLKALPLHITGVRDYKEAIITQGGLRVKEINPRTMESRLAPGIYFAGEILDMDALTGGFNLQIAWSTGYAAGNAARKSVEGQENPSGGEISKGQEKVGRTDTGQSATTAAQIRIK